MPRIFAATLAALFFACTLPSIAANFGVVRGTVTEAGKPQAGASLKLVGEGSTLTTTSQSDGRFVFTSVPFGHYTLSVHVAGATDRIVDIDVTSNSVTALDIDMLKEIASTRVRASAGVSGNPIAVTTLDKEQIQTSPVRDSLNRLIETVPGAVQFSYNEPVINGFHGVTYQIDGAPVPIATTSNFAEIMDPRDIDSLEILTGAIPAEYGGDRIGAVVNIITNRFVDVPQGTYGTITAGAGNQSQAVGELDTISRFGNTEFFIAANAASTARGIDAPTYTAINDNASSSDEFFRLVSRMGDRATLAADYSNQFSQFEIPINVDPNNPNDPVYSVPGTNDTQLEYDRFANVNLTLTSKDGEGVFQFIPWYRSTRVQYNGDLANDVLGMGPNFGCAPNGSSDNYPDCNVDGETLNYLNNVGLLSSSYANYIGLRFSQLRSSRNHTWKVGLDMNRENSTASQQYACYFVGCQLATSSVTPPVSPPYYLSPLNEQAQPGSQFALYAQDKWLATRDVSIDYGLRYDHSTGYTSGWMIEPRFGVNISDGGKNIFHAYYGRFYAAPLLEDVRDACTVFASQNGCATTTPVYDLQPEYDSYYEIGVSHTFGGNFTGSMNLFEKTVSNVLDTTQLLNTPLFAVYNNAIGRDTGLELRLQDRLSNGNSWFVTGTISGSYAGGISGSTFLFPPDVNNGLPPTSPAQLSVEDHDQTVDGTAGYTAHFGKDKAWFSSLQLNYGSGFPVEFQNVNGASLSGRLPAHTTFDLSGGRIVLPGVGPNSQGLGVNLDIRNLLNHQYVIKIANGFNTTQIANSRTFILRLTAPF
jgi:outer membrane receptor protein involved in Fe transport